MSPKFLRVVALSIAFIFTFTSLNPAAFATTPEVSSLPFKTLEIPAEFGQVTDAFMGSPEAPALIHIQSAHGNFSAEKNIENLLGLIEKRSKTRLMLLEGAAAKLQPELFRLFPEHPEFNRKVTDKLMQEGYLTGPESFLIESSKKTEGWGVEDLEAYKKDRDAFIKVVKADKKTQNFLMTKRADLSRYFALKIGKNLHTFVRQEEAFDSGALSFEAWLKTLSDAASKYLRLDLSDVYNQIKWPYLVRYERLRDIGSKLDNEAAMREFNSFIKELETRKISKDIIADFKEGLEAGNASSNLNGYSPLRLAFDRAFTQLPKDFSMKTWPHWTLYAQYVILTQELDGKKLHEETARLKEKILNALAQRPAEKEYVAQTRELNLLRKLFALQLTREEYESLRWRSSSDELIGSDVKPIYEKALDFYATAIVREEKMFANALEKMTEQKQKRAVIVTGGFHADGLKRLAASRGLSYMQITPRIEKVSKRDQEVYLRSILGTRGFETSQMSALLSLDFASMKSVLGQGLENFTSKIDEIVSGLISVEPVSIQPALQSELNNSPVLGRSAPTPSASAPLRQKRDASARSEVRDGASIEDRVRKVIANVRSSIAAEKVTRETYFVSVDSLGFATLTDALKDEFGIEIPGKDSLELLTVGDVVDYIEQKTNRSEARYTLETVLSIIRQEVVSDSKDGEFRRSISFADREHAVNVNFDKEVSGNGHIELNLFPGWRTKFSMVVPEDLTNKEKTSWQQIQTLMEEEIGKRFLGRAEVRDGASIEDQVRTIIARQLEIEDDEVTLKADIEKDLGMDSVGRANLLVTIEDEFEVEISLEEWDELATVQAVVDYLKEKSKRAEVRDGASIEEWVKKIVISELDITTEEEAKKVTLDADLVEDLGVDSLDTVELLMTVEDEFDVEISDEEAEGLKTVGDVVDYLQKNAGRSEARVSKRVQDVANNEKVAEAAISYLKAVESSYKADSKYPDLGKVAVNTSRQKLAQAIIWRIGAREFDQIVGVLPASKAIEKLQRLLIKPLFDENTNWQGWEDRPEVVLGAPELEDIAYAIAAAAGDVRRSEEGVTKLIEDLANNAKVTEAAKRYFDAIGHMHAALAEGSESPVAENLFLGSARQRLVQAIVQRIGTRALEKIIGDVPPRKEIKKLQRYLIEPLFSKETNWQDWEDRPEITLDSHEKEALAYTIAAVATATENSRSELRFLGPDILGPNTHVLNVIFSGIALLSWIKINIFMFRFFRHGAKPFESVRFTGETAVKKKLSDSAWSFAIWSAFSGLGYQAFFAGKLLFIGLLLQFAVFSAIALVNIAVFNFVALNSAKFIRKITNKDEKTIAKASSENDQAYQERIRKRLSLERYFTAAAFYFSVVMGGISWNMSFRDPSGASFRAVFPYAISGVALLSMYFAAKQIREAWIKSDIVSSAIAHLGNYYGENEWMVMVNVIDRAKDPRAVPVLLRLSKKLKGSGDNFSQLRVQIATTLGNIGHEDAIPELERLSSEDPNVNVNAAAEAALDRIASDSRSEMRFAPFFEGLGQPELYFSSGLSWVSIFFLAVGGLTMVGQFIDNMQLIYRFGDYKKHAAKWVLQMRKYRGIKNPKYWQIVLYNSENGPRTSAAFFAIAALDYNGIILGTVGVGTSLFLSMLVYLGINSALLRVNRFFLRRNAAEIESEESVNFLVEEDETTDSRSEARQLEPWFVIVRINGSNIPAKIMDVQDLALNQNIAETRLNKLGAVLSRVNETNLSRPQALEAIRDSVEKKFRPVIRGIMAELIENRLIEDGTSLSDTQKLIMEKQIELLKNGTKGSEADRAEIRVGKPVVTGPEFQESILKDLDSYKTFEDLGRHIRRSEMTPNAALWNILTMKNIAARMALGFPGELTRAIVEDCMGAAGSAWVIGFAAVTFEKALSNKRTTSRSVSTPNVSTPLRHERDARVRSEARQQSDALSGSNMSPREAERLLNNLEVVLTLVNKSAISNTKALKNIQNSIDQFDPLILKLMEQTITGHTQEISLSDDEKKIFDKKIAMLNAAMKQSKADRSETRQNVADSDEAIQKLLNRINADTVGDLAQEDAVKADILRESPSRERLTRFVQNLSRQISIQNQSTIDPAKEPGLKKLADIFAAQRRILSEILEESEFSGKPAKDRSETRAISAREEFEQRVMKREAFSTHQSYLGHPVKIAFNINSFPEGDNILLVTGLNRILGSLFRLLEGNPNFIPEAIFLGNYAGEGMPCSIEGFAKFLRSNEALKNWNARIRLEGNNLIINGKAIKLYQGLATGEQLKELGIDYLIDATRQAYLSKKAGEARAQVKQAEETAQSQRIHSYLDASEKLKVVVVAPEEDKGEAFGTTIVNRVNSKTIKKDSRIIVLGEPVTAAASTAEQIVEKAVRNLSEKAKVTPSVVYVSRTDRQGNRLLNTPDTKVASALYPVLGKIESPEGIKRRVEDGATVFGANILTLTLKIEGDDNAVITAEKINEELKAAAENEWSGVVEFRDSPTPNFETFSPRLVLLPVAEGDILPGSTEGSKTVAVRAYYSETNFAKTQVLEAILAEEMFEGNAVPANEVRSVETPEGTIPATPVKIRKQTVRDGAPAKILANSQGRISKGFNRRDWNDPNSEIIGINGIPEGTEAISAVLLENDAIYGKTPYTVRYDAETHKFILKDREERFVVVEADERNGNVIRTPYGNLAIERDSQTGAIAGMKLHGRTVSGFSYQKNSDGTTTLSGVLKNREVNDGTKVRLTFIGNGKDMQFLSAGLTKQMALDIGNVRWDMKAYERKKDESEDVWRARIEKTNRDAALRLMKAFPWMNNETIVVDASGQLKNKEKFTPFLMAGAGKGRISAPSKGAVDYTMVPGVSQDYLSNVWTLERIASNASCTTNCVSPGAKVGVSIFDIVSGYLSSGHSVTASQAGWANKPGKEVKKSLDARLYMYVGTTGASKEAGVAVPEILGKIAGASTRMGSDGGSIVSLDFQVRAPRKTDGTYPTRDEINQAMERMADTPLVQGGLKGFLGYGKYTDSQEIMGADFGSIFDPSKTHVDPATGTVSYSMWYDNEDSFTNNLFIHTVITALQGQELRKIVEMAAQNVVAEPAAATGMVSVETVAHNGASMITTGDNQTLKEALSAGVKPVLNVSVSKNDIETNQESNIIDQQIRGALEGISPEAVSQIVVALEVVSKDKEVVEHSLKAVKQSVKDYVAGQLKNDPEFKTDADKLGDIVSNKVRIVLNWSEGMPSVSHDELLALAFQKGVSGVFFPDGIEESNDFSNEIAAAIKQSPSKMDELESKVEPRFLVMTAAGVTKTDKIAESINKYSEGVDTDLIQLAIAPSLTQMADFAAAQRGEELSQADASAASDVPPAYRAAYERVIAAISDYAADNADQSVMPRIRSEMRSAVAEFEAEHDRFLNGINTLFANLDKARIHAGALSDELENSILEDLVVLVRGMLDLYRPSGGDSREVLSAKHEKAERHAAEITGELIRQKPGLKSSLNGQLRDVHFDLSEQLSEATKATSRKSAEEILKSLKMAKKSDSPIRVFFSGMIGIFVNILTPKQKVAVKDGDLEGGAVSGRSEVREGVSKRTVRDINVSGDRILERVDFNVKIKDGKVIDDTRIRGAIPTIQYLLDHEATSVTLMSHLGDPEKDVKAAKKAAAEAGQTFDEKQFLADNASKYDLAPVAARLEELLGRKVAFAPTMEKAREMFESLPKGGILLLPNTRFDAREKSKDVVQREEMGKELAAFGDIYVNDAFATAHRANASTVEAAYSLPAVAGFLMERELDYFQEKILNNPAHPFVAVVGGSKLSSKIPVLKSLLPKVDKLIIGGGMAYTFLKAQGYTIGDSLVENDMLDTAKKILINALEHGVKIILPVDHIAASEFEETASAVSVSDVNIPDNLIGMDAGPQTIQNIKEALFGAKTVLVNGPLGVFEFQNFAEGTKAVFGAIADLPEGTITVVGGGDSVTAVNKFGLAPKMSHVSTGGGASLELVEGKVLPAVAVLMDKSISRSEVRDAMAEFNAKHELVLNGIDKLFANFDQFQEVHAGYISPGLDNSILKNLVTLIQKMLDLYRPSEGDSREMLSSKFEKAGEPAAKIINKLVSKMSDSRGERSNLESSLNYLVHDVRSELGKQLKRVITAESEKSTEGILRSLEGTSEKSNSPIRALSSGVVGFFITILNPKQKVIAEESEPQGERSEVRATVTTEELYNAISAKTFPAYPSQIVIPDQVARNLMVKVGLDTRVDAWQVQYYLMNQADLRVSSEVMDDLVKLFLKTLSDLEAQKAEGGAVRSEARSTLKLDEDPTSAKTVTVGELYTEILDRPEISEADPVLQDAEDFLPEIASDLASEFGAATLISAAELQEFLDAALLRKALLERMFNEPDAFRKAGDILLETLGELETQKAEGGAVSGQERAELRAVVNLVGKVRKASPEEIRGIFRVLTHKQISTFKDLTLAQISMMFEVMTSEKIHVMFEALTSGKISKMFRTLSPDQISAMFKVMTPRKISEMFWGMTDEKIYAMFKAMSRKKISAMFKAMTPDQVFEMFSVGTGRRIPAIFKAMTPKKIVAMFEAMTPEQISKMFEALSPDQISNMLEAMTSKKISAMVETLTPEQVLAMVKVMTFEKLSAMFKALMPPAFSAMLPGMMLGQIPAILEEHFSPEVVDNFSKITQKVLLAGMSGLTVGGEVVLNRSEVRQDQEDRALAKLTRNIKWLKRIRWSTAFIGLLSIGFEIWFTSTMTGILLGIINLYVMALTSVVAMGVIFMTLAEQSWMQAKKIKILERKLQAALEEAKQKTALGKTVTTQELYDALLTRGQDKSQLPTDSLAWMIGVEKKASQLMMRYGAKTEISEARLRNFLKNDLISPASPEEVEFFVNTLHALEQKTEGGAMSGQERAEVRDDSNTVKEASFEKKLKRLLIVATAGVIISVVSLAVNNGVGLLGKEKLPGVVTGAIGGVGITLVIVIGFLIFDVVQNRALQHSKKESMTLDGLVTAREFYEKVISKAKAVSQIPGMTFLQKNPPEEIAADLMTYCGGPEALVDQNKMEEFFRSYKNPAASREMRKFFVTALHELKMEKTEGGAMLQRAEVRETVQGFKNKAQIVFSGFNALIGTFEKNWDATPRSIISRQEGLRARLEQGLFGGIGKLFQEGLRLAEPSEDDSLAMLAAKHQVVDNFLTIIEILKDRAAISSSGVDEFSPSITSPATPVFQALEKQFEATATANLEKETQAILESLKDVDSPWEPKVESIQEKIQELEDYLRTEILKLDYNIKLDIAETFFSKAKEIAGLALELLVPRADDTLDVLKKKKEEINNLSKIVHSLRSSLPGDRAVQLANDIFLSFDRQVEMALGELDKTYATTSVAEIKPGAQEQVRSEARQAEFPKIDPATTKAWKELKALKNELEGSQYLYLPNLKDNPARGGSLFTLDAGSIYLDFSKNRIIGRIFSKLLDLASAVGLMKNIEAMFEGVIINETEDREVLHTALRNITRDDDGKLMAASGPVYAAKRDGEGKVVRDGNGEIVKVNVMPEVIEVLEKMEGFSNRVISGEWKGYTGKKITDVVNIGIGGSNLGSEAMYEALKPYTKGKPRVHFVANVDGSHIADTLENLNPETTLFIVASKSFGTQETMKNAETAKKWFLEETKNSGDVTKHFVAVSTAKEKVKAFGIDPKNMFGFWNWVGGRYSVWSAAGLALACGIGFDNFEEFLKGAHQMDRHFLETKKLEKNMPVILALLDIWNINFLGMQNQSIAPYDQHLHRFAAHLQQVNMESNGKSVDRNGKRVTYQTGVPIFGEAGTNSQHSYFQEFHGGTSIVPVDFIGAANRSFRERLSQVMEEQLDQHHKLLFTNAIAQAAALAFGLTFGEVVAALMAKGMSEDEAKALAPHKVLEGDRPSNFIVVDQMTPKAVGELLALYEHRIAAAGFLWNINSFDQYGVEHGKLINNQILAGKTPEDSSSQFLLKKIEGKKQSQGNRSEVRFSEPIGMEDSRAFYDAIARQGKVLVMANNMRSKYQMRGIFRAARAMGAPLLIERSISEFVQDSKVEDLVRDAREAAKAEGYTGAWMVKLHGTIVEDTEAAVRKVIAFVNAAKNAGFGSFSIDASQLVDFTQPTTPEQQRRNIEVIARIVKETGIEDSAWEGEIGGDYNALSTPGEAVTFINGLVKEVRAPALLAINNGSESGNASDMKIDLALTKNVADAIKRWGVRINQRETSGTQPELFRRLAEYGVINANVATHWQNTMWDVIHDRRPDIIEAALSELEIDQYPSEAWDKKIRNFEPRLNELFADDQAMQDAITNAIYESAVKYFKVFGSWSPALISEDLRSEARTDASPLIQSLVNSPAVTEAARRYLAAFKFFLDFSGKMLEGDDNEKAIEEKFSQLKLSRETLAKAIVRRVGTENIERFLNDSDADTAIRELEAMLVAPLFDAATGWFNEKKLPGLYNESRKYVNNLEHMALAHAIYFEAMVRSEMRTRKVSDFVDAAIIEVRDQSFRHNVNKSLSAIYELEAVFGEDAQITEEQVREFFQEREFALEVVKCFVRVFRSGGKTADGKAVSAKKSSTQRAETRDVLDDAAKELKAERTGLVGWSKKRDDVLGQVAEELGIRETPVGSRTRHEGIMTGSLRVALKRTTPPSSATEESLNNRSEVRAIDTSIVDWKSKHGKTLQQILDKFVKEYDFRGFDGSDDANFPKEVDETLLRWVGRALASVDFYSRRHDQHVQLKPGDTFVIAGDNGPSTQTFKNALIAGLRDMGIDVIDLGVTVSGQLYKSIKFLGAQGGLYVTRSHVEVGTNGAKPNIDGITLYGEMLQAAKKQILQWQVDGGEYDKPIRAGVIDDSEATRERAKKAYLDSLRAAYGDLAELIKQANIPVAFNLNSGSATENVDFFREIFGEDVLLIKSEGDPWATQGLADPTRGDKKALDFPLVELGGKSAVQYSVEHPELFLLNFDLDVDRISLLQNGKLYLGDEMFYCVIEYMLTIDPYKDLLKKIYPDSRMKTEFGQMVRYFGGTAKIHPKGHSKVKATIDLLMRQLARANGFSTVQEFLDANPGFRIAQSEYSLHFFLTSDKGEAFDDALEFAFYWLKVFSEIKLKHEHLEWTYADYLKDLKVQKIIQESFQIKEQRTLMPDNDKGPVMDKMKETVMAFFAGRPDFEYQDNWETNYEATIKPYELVNVEGVYHLFTPMGEIFWGQSNTSPKVAFGTQSASPENTKKLAAIAAALLIHSRQEVAPNAPRINPLEAKELFGAWSEVDVEIWQDLMRLDSENLKEREAKFDALRSEHLEKDLVAMYPTPQAALAEFKPVRSEAREFPRERETVEVSMPEMLSSLNVSIRGIVKTAKEVTGGILAAATVKATKAITALLNLVTGNQRSEAIAEKSIARARAVLPGALRTDLTPSDVLVLGHEFFLKDHRAAAGMRKIHPKTTIAVIVSTDAERALLKDLNLHLSKEGLDPILAAGSKSSEELKVHLKGVRNPIVRAVLYGAESIPEALKQQLPDSNKIIVTPRMFNGFVSAVDVLVSGLVSDMQAKFAMARSA